MNPIKKLLLGLMALVFTSLVAPVQTIQAGKSVNITISGVPDQDRATITNTYPVSEGGMINMPFIGPVRAAGMRNDELAASLQNRYKSAGYYTHPTIQVITTAGAQNPDQEIVTVGGYVRAPGKQPYTKELTLWGAVQGAGGATEFGSMRRVKLYRNGVSKTYDVTKPQFKQIPLQRNDSIEVPQKTPWGT